MTISRERLQEIKELAHELSDRKAFKDIGALAAWVSDIAQVVFELDQDQERFEAEIGALSDAVDQIDERIDGIAGEEVEPETLEDLVAELVGDVELDEPDLAVLDVNVPYVVDMDLADNFALIHDGVLHVGIRFADLMARASAE
jgi:hypothetical protein